MLQFPQKATTNMADKTFTICEDTHEKIAFEGTECPLCRTRLQLDRILDDRNDIDEANIAEMDRELKKINRRLAIVEATVGISNDSKWSWLPKLHARAIQNAHIPTVQVDTQHIAEFEH